MPACDVGGFVPNEGARASRSFKFTLHARFAGGMDENGKMVPTAGTRGKFDRLQRSPQRPAETFTRAAPTPRCSRRSSTTTCRLSATATLAIEGFKMLAEDLSNQRLSRRTPRTSCFPARRCRPTRRSSTFGGRESMSVYHPSRLVEDGRCRRPDRSRRPRAQSARHRKPPHRRRIDLPPPSLRKHPRTHRGRSRKSRRPNPRQPNPLSPKKGSDPFSEGLTLSKRGLTPFSRWVVNVVDTRHMRP